jgi:predicted FMN-binding regulatory protein PaiB
MHPNRTFAWTDAEEMLAFVADTAFSTIMFSAGGALRVVHVPVVVAGPDRLHFHLSRANSAAAHIDGAQLLLSCLGPDAYISPIGTARPIRCRPGITSRWSARAKRGGWAMRN